MIRLLRLILPSSRFALTREQSDLILETVLPVSFVIIGIKLCKLAGAYIQISGEANFARLIFTSWLFRILLVFGIAYFVGTYFRSQRKWLIAASPIFVLVIAKVLVALWRGNPAVAYLWLVEAFEQAEITWSVVFGVVRMDLVFLAAFAAAIYAVVTFTPARYMQFLRFALIACTVILLLLSGLELMQYIKTGITGTGHLLGFFVTNAGRLWPMLRAEINFFSLSCLIMPLVIGSVIAVEVHRAYRGCGQSDSVSAYRLVLLLIFFGLAGAFIHPRLVDHRFDQFVDNTYLGLRDLIPWRSVGQLEAVKRANQLPLLFETSKMAVSKLPASTERRNVVIIMLESTRADSTSIYDPSIGTTPFLAEFAKRGAVVSDMYAVIPRTSAAWMAVLDGVWPSTDSEMTQWSRKNGADFSSLPRLLSTQGYTSAFFTTAHLSFSYDADLIKKMKFDSVNDGDSLPSKGFEKPTMWGYEDRMMLDPALTWVKVRKESGDPFLLVIMTTVGHYTYEFPSTWPSRSFGNFDSSHNNYLNCLAYIDSVVRDLVTGLDKLDALRSTVVIILGDHGESFGEHGPRTHALELYEETVKIPGIVYAEGLISPGTKISGLRQEIDVMPTVLDALDLTGKDAVLPGISLLKPIPVDRSLFFSGAVDSQSTAMRKGDVKFIYNFGRTPTEAYSVDQDSKEKKDIAAKLPKGVIGGAEMDMMVWRERVSRIFRATPPAGP